MDAPLARVEPTELASSMITRALQAPSWSLDDGWGPRLRAASPAGRVRRRLQALERHLRAGNWKAIADYLAVSALPPWLFRLCEITIFEHSEVPPPREVLPGFRLHQATLEDIPKLLHIRRRPEHLYRKRLTEGAICHFGELDGDPVSFTWFLPIEWYVARYEAFRFRLHRGDVWMTGGHVTSTYRGKRLYHQHWHHLIEQMRAAGYPRGYYSVLTSNAASIAAHERLGARRVYRLRLFRLAGLIWHHATDLSEQTVRSGFGYWVEDGSRRESLLGT